MGERFVAAERCFLFEEPNGRAKKLTECIWGDWVREEGEAGEGWHRVRTRGRSGFLRSDEIGDERLLEVNFVDVGQGDGALIVTPDDRMLVIDAGEEDNMYRFLNWRFNLRKNRDRRTPPLDIVISHPDADHYRGFQAILDDERFDVKRIFHNGIVERVTEVEDNDNPFVVDGADAKLTTIGWQDRYEGETYLCEVLSQHLDVERLFALEARAGKKLYPRLMNTALKRGIPIMALSVPEDLTESLIPEFEESSVTFQVLGPVLKRHPNPDRSGRMCLPWFGSASSLGETKNGHSVVLRVQYQDVVFLLGGDLNSASERYLQERWGSGAKSVFGVDIAKACHHGSGDFTEEFIELVNAAATVISSGDDESHAHPRPDTLGAIGKYSRGRRPLLFSTELARSTRDTIKQPNDLREKVRTLIARINEEEDESRREVLHGRLDTTLAAIERSVAVYGMITARTDGKKVLMAQKLEAPRANGQKWDVHVLEPEEGVLTYRGKER